VTPVDVYNQPRQYDLGAMTSTFSDIIRENRARLGWSQRTLARHAGVTAGYIALLEKGTRVPGAELWDRLQRIFGMTTSGERSDVDEWPFRDGRTAALAELRSATHATQFDLPLPEEVDWFDTVPFTTVVGPLGSGKTTYVARWLSDVAGRTGRQIVWVQLKPTSQLDDVEDQVLAQVSGDDGLTVPPKGGTTAMSSALARHLEGGKRTAPILCFDDWIPRAGGAHALVPELVARLDATPVVATTESARSSIGAATVRPMPRPTERDWELWCDSSHIPSALRPDFLERIHHNPLAATICKGTVFFNSATEAQAIESNWARMVDGLPLEMDLSWSTVVGKCVDNVSDDASLVIRLLSAAPVPVPYAWLGEYASKGDTSKLLDCNLARFVTWEGGSRLAVHPVFPQNLETPGGETFPWLKEAQPQLQDHLVDLLLNVGLFDEAAKWISTFAEDSLAIAEAPPRFIDWADRVPDEVALRFPSVLFGLVRGLALREASGDLARASAVIERLLSLPLSDGQQWQAINLGTDIAIRSLNYDRALGLIDVAQSLLQTSAGSFDATALDVLRARIAWERSEFEQARAAMEPERRGATNVDSARRTSWQARTFASLGDFGSAAAAANRGIEISRQSKSSRSEAYSAVLLAECELVRGNFVRARRMAERCAQIADSLGLSNLQSQALSAQAEAAAAQGDPKEGHRLLDLATDEITRRGDDPWTNAYRLVTQARLVRLQPRLWTQLWSLAQQLEDEASILGTRNPHHPVIGYLLVESAHSWTTTGYAHRARRVLEDIGNRRVDWRVRWEARLLSAVTEPECSDEERYDAVADLIQEARGAGAPYLAVSCPYLASTYRLVAGDEAMADLYGEWIADVAASRGWIVLASKARALVPTAVAPSLGPTEIAIRNEGETSFAAPRRFQQPSRTDPEIPLPDPFDE
jgi:transcriptional regulator with XRE-family HTH domain